VIISLIVANKYIKEMFSPNFGTKFGENGLQADDGRDIPMTRESLTDLLSITHLI
jgi:hypothetical protein